MPPVTMFGVTRVSVTAQVSSEGVSTILFTARAMLASMSQLALIAPS